MSKVTRGLDRVAARIPRRGQDGDRVFFTLRPEPGGPGYFSRKLSDELARRSVEVTYRSLHGASAALIFSVSWNEGFHARCSRWGVRTVLRLDGFYNPDYFDGRATPAGAQPRTMTEEMLEVNGRIESDLRRSDAVIYQSAFSKETADRHLYERDAGDQVIFNGVDLDVFAPRPKPAGTPPRILCFTSPGQEYMVGTVLPAFVSLASEDASLTLAIVGAMDPIARATVDELGAGLGDRIDVLGAVPNDSLPDLFATASVLAHPRQGDSCPNVVIEAMACGVPVVCASWGGTAELVGDAGVICSGDAWDYGPAFVDRLTEGLRAALGDEGLGVKARARAEAEFDIRRVADRYLSVLGVSAG